MDLIKMKNISKDYKLGETIVNALEITFSGDRTFSPKTDKTTNIEAYNLYLKGRDYWNKSSEEGIHKRIADKRILH